MINGLTFLALTIGMATVFAYMIWGDAAEAWLDNKRASRANVED